MADMSKFKFDLQRFTQADLSKPLDLENLQEAVRWAVTQLYPVNNTSATVLSAQVTETSESKKENL